MKEEVEGSGKTEAEKREMWKEFMKS